MTRSLDEAVRDAVGAHTAAPIDAEALLEAVRGRTPPGVLRRDDRPAGRPVLRRGPVLVVAAAGVVALAGVVAWIGGPGTTVQVVSADADRSTAASSPASAASSSAPQAVGRTPRPAQAASREPLDCGTFELAQAEPLPSGARTCLVDAARTGRPAALVVVVPTIEGDPVTVTYTVTGKDTVHVVHDATKDRFAGEKVTEQTCHGPSVAADQILPRFDSCTDERPAG